jgi:hypothetical protein
VEPWVVGVVVAAAIVLAVFLMLKQMPRDGA